MNEDCGDNEDDDYARKEKENFPQEGVLYLLTMKPLFILAPLHEVFRMHTDVRPPTNLLEDVRRSQ